MWLDDAGHTEDGKQVLADNICLFEPASMGSLDGVFFLGDEALPLSICQ
jgi:hypothetical protein